MFEAGQRQGEIYLGGKVATSRSLETFAKTKFNYSILENLLACFDRLVGMRNWGVNEGMSLIASLERQQDKD